MMHFFDVIFTISTQFLFTIALPFIFLYEKIKGFVADNVWNTSDSLTSDIFWIILEKMSDWSVLSVSTLILVLGLCYLLISSLVAKVGEVGWTQFFGNPIIDIVLSIVVLACLYITSTHVSNVTTLGNIDWSFRWYDFTGGSTILTATTIGIIGSFMLSIVNAIICNIKGQTGVSVLILAILTKAFVLTCSPSIIGFILIISFWILLIVLAVMFVQADMQERAAFVRKFGRKPEDGELWLFMMSKGKN